MVAKFLYVSQKKRLTIKSDSWFKAGVNQYQNFDWDMEVDRFHLNDDSKNKTN